MRLVLASPFGLLALAALSGLVACGPSSSSDTTASDASMGADAPHGQRDGESKDAAEAGVIADASQDDGPSETGDDANGLADARGSSDAAANSDAADGSVDCVGPGSFGKGHGTAFSYGRHYPNGDAAVEFIYGSSGMWGALTGLAYTDNYYSQCATSDRPANESALIGAANGPPYTTRDANCHLLWGPGTSASDPQLEVPDGGAGFAFHEHSGIGANGVKTGSPFTVYWYDDNTLATVMSQAYGRIAPSGIVPYPDFTRWSVISGDAAAWHGEYYGASGNPTSDCCVDTKALNGLYDLASGNFAGAKAEWNSLLGMTGDSYDNATQRYLYPSIKSNYYVGLFKILTDELRANPAAASSSGPSVSELLQHSMSLDSNILDNQQPQGTSGALIGWVTDIPAGTSLINTETVAAEVLGLGARSNSVFEPGVAPLASDAASYFFRPYHALSAVTSAGSQPGYMTKGPGFSAPIGTYAVDFRLRAPAPTGTIATISVYDDVTATVLATHDVAAVEMSSGNTWTEITLDVTVASACNRLELRTYWPGGGNLDVGAIRVR